MAGNTFIHASKWQDIRRRLYFPPDANEYNSSSQPLTDFTQEVFNTATSGKKKSLKSGYIADICRDGSVAPCALILGLIYVKRLSQTNVSYLSSVSPSDLFLISMVVASKYLQDEGEVEALLNSEWAEIGQRPKSVLDKMERDFLSAIDWKLFVSEQEYDNFVKTVEGRIATREAERRGWWNYSDLCLLWDTTPTKEVMTNAGKQTTKVIGSSIGLYVVCITTLLSSSQNLAIKATGSDVINTGYLSRETSHDQWNNGNNDSVNKMDTTLLELFQLNGLELESFKHDKNWSESGVMKNWSESGVMKNWSESGVMKDWSESGVMKDWFRSNSRNDFPKFCSLLEDWSDSKVQWCIIRNGSESCLQYKRSSNINDLRRYQTVTKHRDSLKNGTLELGLNRDIGIRRLINRGYYGGRQLVSLKPA